MREAVAVGSQMEWNASADSLKRLKGVRSWEDFQARQRALGNTKATNKVKGDVFERLVKFYFLHHPDYAHDVEEVWLDEEIPWEIKEDLNLPKKDKGVDILVRTKSGEFWGVQAKYQTNPNGCIPYEKLSTFGTQSAAVTPPHLNRGNHLRLGLGEDS